MSKKLTEQRLFNPLIKWIDRFYDTVENTSLFKEDDELIEEDRKTVEIIDYNIFFSTEKEKNMILCTLGNMLENLIKTYNLKVSHLIKNENLHEKATVIEFLANGGTITVIHDGENNTREFIFSEEE